MNERGPPVPAGRTAKEHNSMATKSRTSFQKRQKEIARMEKQREKAARRFGRKLAKQSAPQDGEATDDVTNPPEAPPSAVE